MKLLIPFLLSVSSSAFAVTPFAFCQAKLLRVTSAALEAELPKHNWDVGQFLEVSYNYGLPGRDRTVFQCLRASDTHGYCLVQVYTRARGFDPQHCPNYEVDEVSSNCDARGLGVRAP